MSVVLSEHLPLLATAPDGIQKLRGLILELAVRGKLVPQDPNDEPASELLKRIAQEQARLEAEGTCKKPKSMPQVAEEARPFEVPEGWAWVRWNDIAQKIGDIDHKMPETVKDGVPYVSPRDFYPDNRIDFQGAKKIARNDFLRLAAKIRPEVGDIIYPRYGTIGENRLVVDDLEFLASYSCCVIKTLNGFVAPKFQFYFSISQCCRDQAKAAENKTTQANVGIKSIQEFAVPLPPLAEQHRIVTKVDELMALCNRLEAEQADAETAHAKLVDILLGTLTQSTDAADLAANWQRLAEHFDTLFTTESSLDALKQTILQLAVMGKLVPQDPNDEPASELLRRIAQVRARLEAEGICKKSKSRPPISEDDQPFPLPKSWAWVSLSDVTTKITDGTHHSPTNLPTGEFKYISAKNIKPWGIDQSGMTFVTKEVHNEIFARCNPEFGDVLYIKDGATTGVAAINTLTEPFSMLSSVALLKPSIGLFNCYLYFVLSSPVFYEEMRAGMTGVAITRVTLAKLNSALFPLPPLAEQHRIVAKVDELVALCDSLKVDLADSRIHQERLALALIESALGATYQKTFTQPQTLVEAALAE